MTMKKKIVLATIVPHREQGEPVIQLSLYYLKTYFSKHSPFNESVDIEILVFRGAETPEKIVESVLNAKPHIIGFSCYVWNVLLILAIAKKLKRERPDVKIVFGGPEVSPRAVSLMKRHDFIDVTIIGEGEEAFTELLHTWFSGETNISEAKGIVYRKNGKVFFTGNRGQIQSLDKIPSPYLEGIIEENDIKDSPHYVPTETMRGCPLRRHFCYYHKGFSQATFFPDDLEKTDKLRNALSFLYEKGLLRKSLYA